MKDVLFIAMVILALLFGGCTESKAPVWGKGDLPAEYVDMFGQGNSARLDWVQNKAIDNLVRRVAALEGNDPNE